MNILDQVKKWLEEDMISCQVAVNKIKLENKQWRSAINEFPDDPEMVRIYQPLIEHVEERIAHLKNHIKQLGDKISNL